MRVIDGPTIRERLSMAEAMAAVEAAFLARARGVARAPRLMAMPLPAGGTLLVMPAAIDPVAAGDRGNAEDSGRTTPRRLPSPYAAVKALTVYPDNPRRNAPAIQGAVLVFSLDSGALVAVLDGDALTAFRTGALTGVAARHLAPATARTALLVGAGAQAFDQARGLLEALSLDVLYLFNRTREKAEALRARLEREPRVRDLGTAIAVVDRLSEGAPAADVIVTATSATEPLLSADMVRPGQTIIAIGSHTPDRAELAPEVVARADSVFVDTEAGARAEAGDLIQAVRTGMWDWSRLTGELADVISREKPGRVSEEALVVMKSVGVGWLDVAVAAALVEGAEAER
ncbi:ornithine cyclodeaminase family protein [Hydrogenibacillus sp. N12]|uniref:ornithine cyclodeaminase family protein n=1 Tax=Hydrogenibacillus sp. N12 TaxID=2866627 RepID=UPI00207C0B7C|nr:ornithine cyclodeaminase family protein [Hydrogenibacillus sp. N12]